MNKLLILVFLFLIIGTQTHAQEVEIPTEPNKENLAKNTKTFTNKIFYENARLFYKLSETDKLVLLDYDETKGYQSWIVGVIYTYNGVTYTHIGKVSFPQGLNSTAKIEALTDWVPNNTILQKKLSKAPSIASL